MTKKRFDQNIPIDTKTIRCSVSFPAHQYAELERIAKGKKVSLAWVVRDATDKYLLEHWKSLKEGN